VLPLFVIGSSGRVSRAAVKESSLHNANVERCVLQVIKRIQFPEPAGGGTVEVTYPFKFRSLGG
jgi:TonB family protein